jgi:hypothetical protein
MGTPWALLRRFGAATGRVVFLRMNPGLRNDADRCPVRQVAAVRLDGHPRTGGATGQRASKRAIGFACTRSGSAGAGCGAGPRPASAGAAFFERGFAELLPAGIRLKRRGHRPAPAGGPLPGMRTWRARPGAGQSAWAASRSSDCRRSWKRRPAA